jgi:hypothetical protein
MMDEKILKTPATTKPASWIGLESNKDAELLLTKGALMPNKRFRKIQGSNAFFAKAHLKKIDLSLGVLP